MEIEAAMFEEFPKIARLSRECVITEKIDGTNAQVLVMTDGRVFAGSRTRMITPEDDNFGFARWVSQNEEALRETLGPGRHFGEWWGSGIRRTYGLKEKRFSLFNTHRWGEVLKDNPLVGAVPVLYEDIFDTMEIDLVLDHLAKNGSIAAPGFDKPEGVVIFHKASGRLFKKTLDKNDVCKWSTPCLSESSSS